jgi:hypothetical protein
MKKSIDVLKFFNMLVWYMWSHYMKYFDKLPGKLHVCKSKWVVPADSAHLGGLNIMGPNRFFQASLCRATWQNKLLQDPLPELPGRTSSHRTPCQGYLAEQAPPQGWFWSTKYLLVLGLMVPAKLTAAVLDWLGLN